MGASGTKLPYFPDGYLTAATTYETPSRNSLRVDVDTEFSET